MERLLRSFVISVERFLFVLSSINAVLLIQEYILLSPNTSLQYLKSWTEQNKSLGFLISVFHCCTEENPADRPKPEELIEMFLTHASKLERYEEV
ncbi:hypothetical protein DITRI_Ditri10aG0054800 [Diplodiscus trichospermus]